MKRATLPEIRAVALLVACLLVSGLCGCSTQEPSQPATDIEVRVVVTQDFGRELMQDEVMKIEDDACAMDALRQVAEIETAYGGGFVNAIDGVRSQYTGGGAAKKDWFIYANGILANVGALDYALHSGDVERWDFHDWSFLHFIPAIIGHFPEPFVHGYEGEVHPTIVAYDGDFEKEAEHIVGKLSQLGVESISVRSANELSGADKESCNLLLLGDMNCELVAELNQVWKRLGFFAYFENGKLVVLNPRGELADEYGAGSGLIQATQSPWNPRGVGACQNVVWMVSGTDETGAKNALDILINRYAEFQYAYAIVTADAQIVRVPRC
ncbi:MAG: DUF4430 domain-containing protein [Chloroflexi bacterium]|nr:DUF4430 domain-containing protein [Chloroflexota bacterium]